MSKEFKNSWSNAGLAEAAWYTCLTMVVFISASVLYSQLARFQQLDQQGAELAGMASHVFVLMGLAAAAATIVIVALRLIRTGDAAKDVNAETEA